MRLAVPLLGLLVACSTAPADEAGATNDAIVGGNVESFARYPATGYLVFKLLAGPHAGEIFRPNCGATLIAPNAVITAAHCVEEKTTTERTVVAVGFFDGNRGPTYNVVGTWRDWTHPRALHTLMLGGEPMEVHDGRHDVAVIQLARPVEDITPLPLTRRRIAPKESALVIGYGRVEGGPTDERDELPNRPDHRDRYPGLRKSADLEVVIARDLIEAYPKPSTDTRKSGGTCFADSGSPMIMADGTVAGVLNGATTADALAKLFDGIPRCRTDAGGLWANLQTPNNAAFIAARLDVAAAAMNAGAR